MFLSAWLISRLIPANDKTPWMAFISGVLAGITVVFKLVFAPLFVCFWLAASVYWFRARQNLLSIVVRIWFPAAIGVVLILGCVVLKFWLDGALAELIWTAFSYPSIALSEIPTARNLRLFESARIFASYYSAWSAFALIAIIYWFRVERDLFTLLMIVWLVGGIGLILIQRFSWWPYHFLILFVPTGVLGVRGLDRFTRIMTEGSVERARNARQFVMIVMIPLIGALAIPANQKVTHYVEIFVVKTGYLRELHAALNPDFEPARQSINF